MVCGAALRPHVGHRAPTPYHLLHRICLLPLRAAHQVHTLLRRLWIVVSKTTPKDYAKAVRSSQLTLPNFKEESVVGRFDKMIPTAAMLGGVIIGLLTVVGDLFDVAGSSTGIMLSISILYGYYEKMMERGEIFEEF